MPLPSLVYIKVNRAKGTDKQSLLLQMGKVGEEVDSALKKMRIIQVGNERKGRVSSQFCICQRFKYTRRLQKTT